MESVSTVLMTGIARKMDRKEKYIMFNDEYKDGVFTINTKYTIIYDDLNNYIVSENGVRYKIDKSLENITYKTGAIVNRT